MAEIFGNTTTTPLDPNAFSGSGSGGTVDQTYNPESENAQSGKAVAEAVATKMDKFGKVTNEGEYSSVTSQNDNLVFNANKKIQLNANEIVLNNSKTNFHGGRLINVGSPTEDTDAATKGYVDTQIGDIETALDGLHAYAQALVNGGAAE